jgi:hypothetical protein
VLGKHADVARAALANIPSGESSLRIGEFVFGLMIDAGMTPREASLSMDRLSLYIVGDAYEGSLHYARMRAAGLKSREEYFESFVGQIADYYRRLPSKRFPHLQRFVDDLVADDGEERFRYGLELLLDGMEARLS